MEIGISVIIPHYNSLNTIGMLLESIPMGDNVEIIVVDDKSDLSYDEWNQFEQMVYARNGILIKNQTELKGAGVCRNIGLDIAKGKWLVFADADDYFLPNAFNAFFREIDTDEDVIHFRATSVYMETQQTSTRHLFREKILNEYVNNHSKANELKLRYDIGSPWAKMVRSSTVKDNGILFSTTKVGNDVMFSAISSFYAKKIAVRNDVVYCITTSANTLTTTVNDDNWLVRTNIFCEHYLFLKEHLEKNDFEKYAPFGIGFLIRTIRQGYGFKTFVKVYKLLRKSGIRIIYFQAVINRIKRKKDK